MEVLSFEHKSDQFKAYLRASLRLRLKNFDNFFLGAFRFFLELALPLVLAPVMSLFFVSSVLDEFFCKSHQLE